MPSQTTDPQSPRQAWHDTQVLSDGVDRHDTQVLPGAADWHDTAVLLPSVPAVAPGWYADPYDAAGARYWDGFNWTDHSRGLSAPGPYAGYGAAPRRRRSVLLAFCLAFLVGGLALPYALPLPAWARLLIAAAIAFSLGWWLLLVIPLTWPFALVLVPLLTALFNPRR